MKDVNQTQGMYDNPWIILNLMKNLNKSGFNAVFSFEQGILKLIIQRKGKVADNSVVNEPIPVPDNPATRFFY